LGGGGGNQVFTLKRLSKGANRWAKKKGGKNCRKGNTQRGTTARTINGDNIGTQNGEEQKKKNAPQKRGRKYQEARMGHCRKRLKASWNHSGTCS